MAAGASGRARDESLDTTRRPQRSSRDVTALEAEARPGAGEAVSRSSPGGQKSSPKSSGTKLKSSHYLKHQFSNQVRKPGIPAGGPRRRRPLATADNTLIAGSIAADEILSLGGQPGSRRSTHREALLRQQAAVVQLKSRPHDRAVRSD